MSLLQLFPVSLQFNQEERFLGHTLKIKEGPSSLSEINKMLALGHDYYEDLYEQGNYQPRNNQYLHVNEENIVKADAAILNDFYTWHHAFRNTEAWDLLSQLNPTKKALLKCLKQQWLSHAAYSHYSPENIFKALKHIQKMLKFVHKGQYKARNLWVWKKNRPVKAHLIKILNEQEKILHRHQILLCESLYQRIGLCIKEGSLETSDPLAILLSHFHKHAINTSCLKGIYESKPSPLALLRACGTIFTYGSQEQKIALRDTLTIKSGAGDKARLKLIADKESLSLVPAEFLKFIPSKTTLFPRLFRGYPFCSEFFKLKERQELLFHLMTSSQLEFKAPFWSLEDDDWQRLLKVGNLIEGDLSRVKKLIEAKNYSGESETLLKTWRTFLENRKNFYLVAV